MIGYLNDVLAAWNLSAERVVPHDVGRINDTWFVGEDWVLQRLNHNVFADPKAVMANLVQVLAHDETLLVAPRLTSAGHAYQADGSGDLWRLFPRVMSRNFETLPPALYRSAATAFGGFLRRMQGFDGALAVVIDGFHDLDHHLAALASTPPGADAERRLVDDLRHCFGAPVRTAVIHGDCKVSNLLFHSGRDAVVAIIDLDTVMIGDPAWDFGDLVRSVFAGGGEEESTPVTRAGVQALSRGFVEGVGELDRVDRFAAAPAYMSFMLGVRFLTDHLAGDVYFKVAQRGDNQRRAQGQLTLARRFLDAKPIVAAALDVALGRVAAAKGQCESSSSRR